MNVRPNPSALDTAAAAAKTGSQTGEEGPPAAVDALARGDTETGTTQRPPLVEKVQALAGALIQAERASAREASRRSSLTVALAEALAVQCEAAERHRAQALQLYRRTAPRRTGRRRAGWIDLFLARLRWPGQTLVIARSGLWRRSGSRVRDLAQMAAYVRRGHNPKIAPHAPLHQAWYLSFPDAAASRQPPLVHFLISGVRADRSPHPLFDVAFYRARNADALAATGMSPVQHFVWRGAAEGRDPHPLFSLAWYLGQAPEVAESGENPILHYMTRGWRDGLSPHPLFDAQWYSSQLTTTEAEAAPLAHYLAEGWRLGLSPHPLFDAAWYLERYADVARSGAEPLSHFAAAGGAEGRSPGPWFDSSHYAAVRGEALKAGANPLVDYITGGAWRVGEARPGFPTSAYLSARPELARAGLTPLEHWARLAGPPARTG